MVNSFAAVSLYCIAIPTKIPSLVLSRFVSNSKKIKIDIDVDVKQKKVCFNYVKYLYCFKYHVSRYKYYVCNFFLKNFYSRNEIYERNDLNRQSST